MARDLLLAVIGIFIFMAFWLAVQSAFRRQMAKPSDVDVLEPWAHGCGGCSETACARQPAACRRGDYWLDDKARVNV
ncbi:MAG: hypothetical protein NZV14_15195 [Bryobacteraceae bacterium]|nr:hypothetical protein [Bryobacteraceae bacterium]MDW8379509.1 hypothetical protein [Bryobacterales bacterium]